MFISDVGFSLIEFCFLCRTTPTVCDSLIMLSQIYTRLTRKRRCRNIIYSLFIFPFIVYCCVKFYFEVIPPQKLSFKHLDVKSECILPDVDPFDPRVTQYLWKADPITCDDTPSLMFVDYSGILQLNRSVFPESKTWDLNCTYSIVDFVTDDNDVKFLPEIEFNPPMYINADVFLVQCKKQGNLVFKDLVHKIDFKTILRTKHIGNETDEKLSVFLLGLDSVSRLTAIRKLPKTMAYLHQKLEAYTFKGYTKIGGNTYPNLVGMLTGKFASEHNFDDKKDYMDKLNLIWKNFSDSNYVTSHGEDWPELATFNYLGTGFMKPPTMHYLRRYTLAMNKVQPFHQIMVDVALFIEKYVKLRKRSALCFGNRKIHMIILEFCKQFLEAYRGKLKFNFAWLVQLAHENINFVGAADQDLYEFFKWMYEKRHLNKTVLIFCSDHGSRQDDIRNSYIGRMEDRMPLLSIVIPEHIKRKYPHIHENLLSNTERLTSTFDTFQTLSDILHGNFTNKTSPIRKKPPWGKSLFEKIPQNRTCFDAKIPEEFCTCYVKTNVDIKNQNVIQIAKFIKGVINKELMILGEKCSKLSLSRVKRASKIHLPLERVRQQDKKTLRNYLYEDESATKERYTVTIETIPGKAIFEATVELFIENQKMLVIGDIDRINRYGNQSSCTNHRTLRAFCYCK